MRSTLKTIENHPKLELSLLVTGMHLLPEFGDTINEIKKDNFKIAAKVDMISKGDTGCSMAKSIGKGILGIAEALKTEKPSIVLLQGDRSEMLAAAIAAAHMNIPIAHMSGGDITKGVIDNSVRNAITKFSHIHFPSTKESAERIIQMAEDPWRVHLVGNPGVDIKKEEYTKAPQLIKKFGIDPEKKLLLVIQHPVTTEIDQTKQQIQETLESIFELGEQTIVIYPNVDAGHKTIIDTIKKYEHYPFIRVYKNFSRVDFVGILHITDVIIGNSSCGVVEVSSLNVPAVNIGNRQKGRERSTKNVIDVGHNKDEIINAIKKALYDKKFREEIKECFNPYVCEGTEEKIVKVLSEVIISPQLLNK